MEVHKDLKNKIMYFIKNKKIPHMVFHGPSGSGKRTVLAFLLENIYRDVVDYKNYIMYINCAHGKGIKFIREGYKTPSYIISHYGCPASDGRPTVSSAIAFAYDGTAR